MDKFAVTDTETNWNDRVMSIGIVAADADTKEKRKPGVNCVKR